MSVRRFLKKADKAFGTNGYKRKTVKAKKGSRFNIFREGTDDDCGGDN